MRVLIVIRILKIIILLTKGSNYVRLEDDVYNIISVSTIWQCDPINIGLGETKLSDVELCLAS